MSLDIDWKDFKWPGFVVADYTKLLPEQYDRYEGVCPHCEAGGYRIKAKNHWLFKRKDWEFWHNKKPWTTEEICHNGVFFEYCNAENIRAAPHRGFGDPRYPSSFQPEFNLGFRRTIGPLSTSESRLITTWIMRGKPIADLVDMEVFITALWFTALWPKWAGIVGMRQATAFTALHYLRGWSEDGGYRTFWHAAGRHARNKNKQNIKRDTSIKKK